MLKHVKDYSDVYINFIYLLIFETKFHYISQAGAEPTPCGLTGLTLVAILGAQATSWLHQNSNITVSLSRSLETCKKTVSY